MHCTDGQLLALMDDCVLGEQSDDQARALNHLERCPACRHRLQHLSGEGDWLDDLLESVRMDMGQFAALPTAASVVVTADAGDPLEPDGEIHCESVRLDFLDPPRHPELLGRLGRYDIEQLIGMGGFGIVFKARDSELNRVVAIKVLAPHLMSSGAARKRFAREAQASAAVVHDHVVAIHDVVSQAHASYFVMQYVAGESLQQRVDRRGPLPMADVLRIAAQMALGLQAAHQQGLIHRDVKPANALLEDSVDRVLLSDFGLARTADDASITRSGVISGTPHYMSPEQSRGAAIDCRSDLFSLGSVIYFMCTGRTPFRAPRMVAVLNRICHEPHRPLEALNPEVPAELSDLVDRLLCKDPEARFASAAEVGEQLNQLLRDLQSGTLRPRRRTVHRAAERWKWVVGGVALLLTLFALGYGVTSWRTPSRSEPSPLEAALRDDRLAQEMVETARMLRELESALSAPAVGVTTARSEWNQEIAEIEVQLSALEESLESNLSRLE